MWLSPVSGLPCEAAWSLRPTTLCRRELLHAPHHAQHAFPVPCTLNLCTALYIPVGGQSVSSVCVFCSESTFSPSCVLLPVTHNLVLEGFLTLWSMVLPSQCLSQQWKGYLNFSRAKRVSWRKGRGGEAYVQMSLSHLIFLRAQTQKLWLPFCLGGALRRFEICGGREFLRVWEAKYGAWPLATSWTSPTVSVCVILGIEVHSGVLGLPSVIFAMLGRIVTTAMKLWWKGQVSLSFLRVSG